MRDYQRFGDNINDEIECRVFEKFLYFEKFVRKVIDNEEEQETKLWQDEPCEIDAIDRYCN